MSEGPERPPAVPADADWKAAEEKWELAGRDATGALHGEQRLYRPDGTLHMSARYVGGVQEGAFAIYHPDGQLAREGRYRGGQIDGVVVTHAGQGEGAEPLRSCCVPENAWQMRSTYEDGQMVNERFFDREGRVLLSDGSLRPTPPAGVPEAAEYDEGSQRWLVSPRLSGAALWRSCVAGGV